jgi:hypothetical protein
MEIDQRKSDYFNDITFHPSLDVKDNILVLGFRVKPSLDKEENIFYIFSNSISLSTRDASFEIDGKTYQIDLKNRKLAKLSKQWNRDELDIFIKSYSSGKVSLPRPNDIFDKVRNQLKRHIELDEADQILLVIWAIGTYFFPIFAAYPYLHIKAPKGSGKTQCLSFLNQVCFTATKARASLPALRDTVDSLRGTYLMDQADALHRNNMEDLLDILTDSYKRGGGDIRKMVADKGKNWNLEEFQAYGPKAFASINQLPEDLRDRCQALPLMRSRKNFRPLDEEEVIWKEIRGDIYKLLITNFSIATSLYVMKSIEYRRDTSLVGRQLELWLPLEVLMTVMNVPGEEQKAAKARFLSQYVFTEYQVSDLERVVVETILELLNDKIESTLSPKDIADKINSDIFEDSDFSLKQQSARVGKIINKFNLSSTKLTRSNKGERYVFTKEKVEKIYAGYFSTESEVEDTPTYTPGIEAENVDLF